MLPDKLVPAPDNMKLHEINVDRIYDVFQLSYKINSSQQKKNFNVIPGPPAIRKTASRITSSRTFTKNEVEQQQKEDQHIECDQKVTKEKQPVKQVKQKPNDSSLQKRLDWIKKALDDDKKGFYYAVFYGNDYWGKVLNVFDSDDDAEKVEMTFLRYKSDGLWVFPRQLDKEIFSVKYLFFGPVSPAVTSVSGFRFNEKDIEAKKLFKIFQKSDIYD